MTDRQSIWEPAVLKQVVRERVTKSPLERKQELIDAATRLFNERGYEQTAVSDIVREVEVAQGTFYYYFSSKEEILEAVIEKDMALLEESVRQIMRKEGADAAMKINAIVNGIIGISSSRKEIMDYLHLESNAVMHEKMERHIIERLVPLMAKVIAGGDQELGYSIVSIQQNWRSSFLLLLSTFSIIQRSLPTRFAATRCRGLWRQSYVGP